MKKAIITFAIPFGMLIQFVHTSTDAMSCDKESIFLKSTEGMIVMNMNKTEEWQDTFSSVSSDGSCFGRCQLDRQCKSAHNENHLCLLRNVDRFTVNARIQLTNGNYYEKQECPLPEKHTKFVSVVKDATDCKDVYDNGWRADGVYVVEIKGTGEYQAVSCVMSLIGGGWTVVQQRFDASVDFNRNWMEYKAGFGTLSGEFWYGNDRLHNLTQDTDNEILFQIKTKHGVYYYPLYEDFKIAAESDGYRLSVGSYKYMGKGPYFDGNAHRNFGVTKGSKFSTIDNDNDDSNRFCAGEFLSGWWFKSCTNVNLNAPFAYADTNQGTKWDSITFWGEPDPETYKSLKTTKMMIRKKN